MRGAAKILAILETVLVLVTVGLGVWVGWKTMQGIRVVRLLQVVWPGTVVEELATGQGAATRLAVAGEVLWAATAMLGTVAAFGLWRLRRVGLHASILLSIIYVVCVMGRWYDGSTWLPMASLVLVRMGLAAPLVRNGLAS